jgi:glycosyltransferase involved in cell wall biosynthesis
MSSTCDASRPRVAVVLSGWPRVSEVFAVNELLALDRAGMLAAVFATKQGESGPQQPQTGELDLPVEVLPPGDVNEQADALAERIAGTGVAAIHGYFAHQPTAVAAAAARRLGIPYGFSAHALDVRKVPRPELAERARKAALVVCCNADADAGLRAAGARPHLLRHGVDLSRFPVTAPPGGPPVTLLAVGRLVEKKGFDVLLEAMELLERPSRLRLIGTGPLQQTLQAAVEARGLTDRVELVGRVTHQTLPAEYAAADIVVVPSIVDSGGDRDGLPNVVLEAMASGRPVVGTDVGAIATAVHDGVTGIMVPPRDPEQIAYAITRLVDDTALRGRLGAAARRAVETRFDLAECTIAFCRTLEHVYG